MGHSQTISSTGITLRSGWVKPCPRHWNSRDSYFGVNFLDIFNQEIRVAVPTKWGVSEPRTQHMWGLVSIYFLPSVFFYLTNDPLTTPSKWGLPDALLISRTCTYEVVLEPWPGVVLKHSLKGRSLLLVRVVFLSQDHIRLSY